MPKTVTTTRQLKAPPDRVYRAWTDPADVKRWFKPTGWIMNPQVEGLWHSEVEGKGKRWPHYGRFTRLERPRLFEQTWMSEATHGIETVVRLELEPKEGGTQVTLTHSGLPDDEAENHRRDGRRSSPRWTICADHIQVSSTRPGASWRRLLRVAGLFHELAPVHLVG